MILGVAFRVTTAPAASRRPAPAGGQTGNPRRHRPADPDRRDPPQGKPWRAATPGGAEATGLPDVADLPSPLRAAAAERAFAAGNGYLTGLIVDRLA